MLDLLAAAQNAPFSIALSVMLGIAALEAVATLMGMGLSGPLDALLPDVGVDAAVDALHTPPQAVHGRPLAGEARAWLPIRRVPNWRCWGRFPTSRTKLSFIPMRRLCREQSEPGQRGTTA